MTGFKKFLLGILSCTMVASAVVGVTACSDDEETSSGSSSQFSQSQSSSSSSSSSQSSSSNSNNNPGEPGGPAPTENLSSEECMENDGTTYYKLVGIGTYDLPNLTIPASYNGYPVSKIGDSAFKNNKTLKNVVIPGTITDIHEEAFSNCTSLQSVTIETSATIIPVNCFYNCDRLTSVKFNTPTVTEIGMEAFYDCDSLFMVKLPENLVEIKERAFAYCDNFSSDLEMPITVTTIGYDAFYQCNGLNIYTGYESRPDGWDSTMDYCNVHYAQSPEHQHLWLPMGSLEATCGVEGSATYMCFDCNEMRTITIPAYEHDYQMGKCTYCRDYNAYVVKVIDNNGNAVSNVRVYVADNSQAASTDADGVAILYTDYEMEYALCVDGYDSNYYSYETTVYTPSVYGEVTVVLTHTHNYAYDYTIQNAATCTETGLRYNYCVCGDYQEEILPIDTVNGHNYVNGDCEYCDDYNAYVIRVIDNNGNAVSGVRVYEAYNYREASTDADGVAILYTDYEMEYALYVDNYDNNYYSYETTVYTPSVYGEVTVVLTHTHNYNNGSEIIAEPTCTETGLQYNYCICGEYEEESIDMVDHLTSVNAITDQHEVSTDSYTYTSYNYSYGFYHNNGVFTSNNYHMHSTTAGTVITITEAGTYRLGAWVDSESSTWDYLHVYYSQNGYSTHWINQWGGTGNSWQYADVQFNVGDTITATYRKDSGGNTGQDCAQISIEKYIESDTPLFTIQNDENNPFEIFMTEEGAAFKSTNHEDNSVSTLTVTVNATTTITFGYAVSSEENSDYFSIYVDGELYNSISGENSDGDVVMVYADSVVTILYSKDSGGSSGSDCGAIVISSPCLKVTENAEECVVCHGATIV